MSLSKADLAKPLKAFCPTKAKLCLKKGVLVQAGRYCVSVVISGTKYLPEGSLRLIELI